MKTMVVRTKSLPYKEIEVKTIDELAMTICKEGLASDLVVTEKESGCEVLDTFGYFINKIHDMDFRIKLLDVLIPMQHKIEEDMFND